MILPCHHWAELVHCWLYPVYCSRQGLSSYALFFVLWSVWALRQQAKRSGSAKLNMLDKCIIGAFSHGIGAVTGGHHEQIIWAANPPRIQFGVQGQGGFGRVA
jgi:hypothetical protein